MSFIDAVVDPTSKTQEDTVEFIDTLNDLLEKGEIEMRINEDGEYALYPAE